MDKNIQPISFNKTDGTLILPENTTVVTREMIEPYRDSVTKIVMPNGVSSIEEFAFSGCESLTSIGIPSSVTSIEKGAFYRCSGLTAIEIPDSVTSIEEWAFYRCSGLTAIEIPDSVTVIREMTFEGCSGLRSITIPEGVTSIGSSAFFGCSGLTAIEIPSSVTEIGAYAFRNCTSLTNITIPEGVTEIGSAAFSNCPKLKYIIVPEELNNHSPDFWLERGVNTRRIAIYGLQDLMQNSALQSKALQDLREGVSSPAYQSLTGLNPLAHVPLSGLLEASSNLANLCLPSIVTGTGVVKATKVNWGTLLRPLGSKAVDCAKALAQWLSLYDIRNMQMAKVTAPRPKDMQVVLYQPPAPQSEDLDKNSRKMLSNTPPLPPELSPRAQSHSPSLGA